MDKNKIAISTYEKIAHKYSDKYFNDLTDIPYIDKFLKNIPSKGRILDIGCGPGQFSQYIAKKGFHVIGLDYSREMIEIARAKVPEVEFKYMDMRNLEFEENSFDGILAAYSLIHISSENILDTLKEFNKVLKPSGYIEIIVQKGEADRVIDEPFMPSEKMFFNFFTKARLSKYLREANFQITYQSETASQDSDSMSDKVIYTIAQKGSAVFSRSSYPT